MHAPDRREVFPPCLEHLSAATAILDSQMRYLAVSRQWLRLHNLEEQNVIERAHEEVFPHLPPDWAQLCRNAIAGTAQTREIERRIEPDGSVTSLEWEVQPWQHREGKIGGIFILAQLSRRHSPLANPSENLLYPVGRDRAVAPGCANASRNRAENWARGQARLLEAIATGAPLTDVLTGLTQLVEQQSPGMLCSILLLDRNGTNLHLGAAPSLPESYNRAIDGGAIGANVASCGTAAYLGKTVIAADIATEPLWEDYRDLALSHGLRACWSAPIFSSTGKVLGTFGIYYRQAKTPSAADLHLIEIAAHLAGIAIERQQKDEALLASETRFQKLAANVPGMIYQYRLTPEGAASFTYVSPGCRELYEVEPDVMLQSPPNQWCYPDDLSELIESVAASARTLEPWTFQWRIVTESGKIKWVQAASRPEKFANGDIIWDGLLIDITDRKLAEEALRHSEANLADAQKLAHVGSWEFDLATQTLSWSDELYRIFGLPTDRSVPTFPELREMIHPDDREFWETSILQAIAEGKNAAFEHRIIRPDGSVRYLDNQGQPLFKKDGQLLKMFGTSIDITERKTAEIALRQYQEHLEDLVADRTAALAQTNQQLLEEIAERRAAEQALHEKEIQLSRCLKAARMGVWQWNFKTGQTLNSEGTDLLFDRPSGSLNSFENFLNCLHPDDRETLVQAVQKAVEQQVNLELDYRVVWRDGSIRWIAAKGDVLRDETGNAAGMAGTCMDVSDRKQAEEILRLSEAREREKATQLEQALYQLKRTQSQLIQSEKMSSLGQLVAGVAHEINNPVNFIYGNLVYATDYARDLLNLIGLYRQHYSKPVPQIQAEIEAIDLDFLMADLPRLLSSMKVGADRIRDLVLSLRNFSRLDESERKAADIHDGIESTLMILQSRLKAKYERPGIQVIKEYGNLPKFECYPGPLNQVFMNILANAIDALEEANREGNLPEKNASCPTIRIATEVVDTDRIAVRIADNGPGMPEEVRRKIFDPFFTTKPVGKGTGLGLSISYQIVVEKHGGKLECHSQIGQGTEFVIEIPRR